MTLSAHGVVDDCPIVDAVVANANVSTDRPDPVTWVAGTHEQVPDPEQLNPPLLSHEQTPSQVASPDATCVALPAPMAL